MKVELSPSYARARRAIEMDILTHIVQQPSIAREYMRLHVVPDEFLDPENKALFHILLSYVNGNHLFTDEVVKETKADAEAMVTRLAYMITKRNFSYSPQETADAFWRIADIIPAKAPKTRSAVSEKAAWSRNAPKLAASLKAIRDSGRRQHGT